MPVVRAYRFEPPARQLAVSTLELDDYLLTHSGSAPGAHSRRGPACPLAPADDPEPDGRERLTP